MYCVILLVPFMSKCILPPSLAYTCRCKMHTNENICFYWEMGGYNAANVSQPKSNHKSKWLKVLNTDQSTWHGTAHGGPAEYVCCLAEKKRSHNYSGDIVKQCMLRHTLGTQWYFWRQAYSYRICLFNFLCIDRHYHITSPNITSYRNHV